MGLGLTISYLSLLWSIELSKSHESHGIQSFMVVVAKHFTFLWFSRKLPLNC